MKRRAFLVCWVCLAAIGLEAGAQGATDLPRARFCRPILRPRPIRPPATRW
jgi:hypothetical protein